MPREQDATTCAVKVGDLVRVKPSVLKPHLGWGSVSHRSVGKIVALDHDRKRCTVDFPEQGGWRGLLEEMEVDKAEVRGLWFMLGFPLIFFLVCFRLLKTGTILGHPFSKYGLRHPACNPLSSGR